MRVRSLALLSLALGAAAFAGGCSHKAYDGPTVDAFTGRLTHGGQPVTFPEGGVSLQLFHEKGQSFGVPVQPDGSFEIGWMPTGKYSATLLRAAKPAESAKGKAPPVPSRYAVPEGLNIEAGKTDYTVELGKNWKA